ncbi:MAG: ComEA family DNA-binding protein [Fervidobacterium sp.]|uniref:Competence protein ComEA n=1 Tax=Fervidobacterium gondwanense DSM 13020 TaxID=1121883 RepID=A0A1M7RZF7_FERGO|nr:ComEA family DNA-binding protein [Fervidobacterium gondwanense]SHN51709.1 competence protein ComEA [Fervidobacterium gondwanense DSM 13020]
MIFSNFDRRNSGENTSSSLFENIKALHKKASASQRAFFILFALIIVLSGVLYQPSYNKLVQESVYGQEENLEVAAESAQRKYTSSVIDINTASLEELQTLPGIGPSKARAIVKYREKQQFSKIEDIMNVPGIGEKTFEKLKDRIKVSIPNNQSLQNTNQTLVTNNAENQPTNTYSTPPSINKTEQKININTAGIEELQKLPGIGPAKAQEIINYRTKNGPFRSIDEIMNVKGIGEKTFEKMKDMITTR